MRFFEDLVIHASFCCYVGMNLLLINLCFVAGTCVNVARLVRLTRANRKYAIPLLFGRPIVQPNGGGLSVIAVLLFVPGIAGLQKEQPWWCFFWVALFIGSTVFMLLWHNLAVRRAWRNASVGQAREE